MLVAVIALVVLGPNRLPQAARTVGKLLAEARRLSSSLQSEVTDALAEPRQVLSKTVGDLGLEEIKQSVLDTVRGSEGSGVPPGQLTDGSMGAPPSTRPPAGGRVPERNGSPSGLGIPDDPSLN